MLSRIILRNPVATRSLMTVARPTASTLLHSRRTLTPFLNSGLQIRKYSEHADEETFEEFTTRFEKEFDEAYDLFEVQRVLNNCFSYDLVPAPAVLEKALRAARRVNDLPTAIRVFEALKYKVENEDQYKAYLEELNGVREELGVPLKEELFPNAPSGPGLN
ncbi:similar to Saccharomyces cerevisiae YHR051W COX6 Subunit VI of cytochrome c oxidase, which is the terminal member of the mitochondrial inner membrane electron transport chain [Maudiozyma saulgeensis]|uniref:Cytochrome c oxidase subunit 6, mitochondrial n=1 Tax=Maudiozyma saulgeensis TaxID=1789683 RepID=A0A1X7QZ48_9SACH|nr:similar to Saccharomyces cerevisiae YHR051W COX6 Subunit VI of cytochrome c oxidase, which is the terminal member of the mitochondrial inner membrane electron transport chain [Kazachstania saulgeensis]